MRLPNLAALLGLVVLLSPLGEALAQPPQFLPAPPPPPPVQSGEALTPDVTIVRRQRETITEYRLHGRLYMVKVTPKRGGYSYYLTDSDGDGDLETQQYELAPGILVPSWVLFRW